MSAAEGDILSKSKEEITGWLVERIARELGIGRDQIDVNAPFSSFGVSSIIGVSMSGDIAESLGVDVPPTLLWDYPTIAKLVDYLAELPKGSRAAA